MDWFYKRVDLQIQSLVCIDPSNKSSTACFVKISPSPNFLIIVYEVVLDNFIAGMKK